MEIGKFNADVTAGADRGPLVSDAELRTRLAALREEVAALEAHVRAQIAHWEAAGTEGAVPLVQWKAEQARLAEILARWRE